MADEPATEAQNSSTVDLDRLSTRALLQRINDEDRRSAWAVEREIGAIAAAVDAIYARLTRGGRVHYFGAGTSGRIAVMDAAELPPTFSIDPRDFVAHIAGGADALTRAVEGAEDDEDAGRREAGTLREADVAIGVSASGRAPYVLAAIGVAKAAGALTVGITNNLETPLAALVGLPIVLQTGAEAIAGSTRMKAAGAQKMALTMLSTAVMVKLGHVHGNLMVDVGATNAKLRARAVRMTAALAGVSDSAARAALERADYKVKVAVIMLARNCDASAAKKILTDAAGSLRTALEKQ